MQDHEKKLISLFNRISNGDSEAFSQLHRTLFKPLLQYAVLLLRSKQIAEEATSDLFIKLWSKRTELAEIKRPQIYVFSALKNICLNILQRDKSNQYSHVALEAEEIRAELVGPEELISNKELIVFLQAAVELLPSQQKLVFTLIKEQELKRSEVADLLGISIRTVENHLYKAVKFLAHTIELYLDKNPLAKEKQRTN